MLDFMEYMQQAFYDASNWNLENSYGHLTASATALLDFDTPCGLRLNLSSLATPNLATSYALGSVGLVDGSLSYLHTTIPQQIRSRSANIALHNLIRGYRQVQELRRPEEPWITESLRSGRQTNRSNCLLYGRLYLPQSTLEALYLRRISPTQQIRLSAVSKGQLRNGGTILALHQYDVGKYTAESLYSTDGGLLGVRGLYNFGLDPRKEAIEHPQVDDRLYGRFSAGAEIYYGALNKSGGISLGGRFATLPAHKGVPLTATMTLNPLMGNISTTYSVKAGHNLSLGSKLDFNIYSYESDLVVGLELWRMKIGTARHQERSMAAKLAWTLDNDVDVEREREAGVVSGVLKARIDQNWKIRLLWEGRIKELLFTLGSSIDMKRREQPFRAFGLEIQYSS